MLALPLVLVAAYVALCAWIYVTQRSMVYFPVPPSRPVVGAIEPVTVDGAVLQNIVLRRPGRGALLYFGGNAEDVAQSIGALAALCPHRTLVFVRYRGYGGSSGTPSEAALVADAKVVFDSVAGDRDDIVVVGRSLGSGVAVQLAASRPGTKLVLITPFNSLVAVGRRALPWFPVGLLARDRFRSDRFAADVKAPTLVIAAGQDEVIPPSHAEQLARAFGRSVRSVTVPDAGHNDIHEWAAYQTALADFINSGA